MNNRLKKLCRLAVLIALQIVLSRFLSPTIGESFKLGFGFLAIMLAGALEGYLGGVIVASVSDVLGAILFPKGSFFIGYTLTAALTGLILGAFLYSPKKTVPLGRIIIAYVINALLVTLALNTACIAFQYGWLLSATKGIKQVISRFFVYLPKRALEAVIMLPVQVLLTWLLLGAVKLDKRLGYYQPIREFPAIRAPKWLADLILAVPVCTCLTIELYNLPAAKGDLGATEYITTFLFPDALITTLAFAAAYLLLRFRPNAKHTIPRIVFSIILAAIFVLSGVYSAEWVVFSFDIFAWALICLSFAGAFILFYALSAYTIAFLHLFKGEAGEVSLLKTWLLIFICCLPYLLITRGVIHTDTYDQLRQYAATFFDHSILSRTISVSTFYKPGMLLNDTQPVFDTLLMGVIFFSFSSKISVFLIALIQLMLSSLVAASGIKLVSQLGLKHKTAVILKLFYALFPYFHSYFCATVKESAFAIAFLYSMIFIVKLFAFPKETSRRYLSLFFGAFSILMCVLLRFFGLYVLALPIVCLCVYLFKQRLFRPTAFIASALVLAIGVNYGVFNLIGVGKGPFSEKIPIMLAQTALYYETYPEEVTDEEKAVLDEFLSPGYDPHHLDSIKMAALQKKDESEGYKWSDYFRVWKQMGLRKPWLYLNPVLSLASKYWELKKNPTGWQVLVYLGDYGRYQDGFEENPRDLSEGVFEYRLSDTDLKLHYYVKSFIKLLSGLPVVNMLFKCGTYLFALLFGLFYGLIKRKRGISLIISILAYGICLGFGPVSGSGRYAFPIVFSVPIILPAVLLLPDKKKDPAESPDK